MKPAAKSPRASRRLLVLLLVLVTVGGAAGGTYAYRTHRLRAKIARWRVEGLTAARSGDPATAVERLIGYLTYHPSDREALVAYVEARPLVESPDGRHLVETVRALRYLVQLEPNQVTHRVRLLDLYRKLGLRSESADAAAEVLKLDPVNPHGLEVRAAALAELKRYPESLEVARRWAEVEPNNLRAHILTFSLRAAIGELPKTVLDDVDAWGGHHPDDPARLELLRACAHAAFGQRDECLSELRKAAKHAPPDEEFCDILVSQFAGAGDGAEDVAVLRDLCARGAGPRIRRRLLARLWELGNFGEVATLARDMDRHDPATTTETLALVALTDAALGRTADAAELRQVIRARPGAVAAAWATILEISGRDAPSARAIVTACRQALATEPRQAYLRYFMGEALASLGETHLAIEVWQQEAVGNATWGLPLARAAELCLEQGDATLAARSVAAALRRSPTTSTGLVVARVAGALLQSGQTIDTGAMLQLIDQLEKDGRTDGVLPLLRAQILIKVARRDEAVRAVRGLLDQKRPAPGEATLLQAAALSRAENLGIEVDLWQRSEDLYGLTPSLALNRALAAAGSGDRAAGLRALDEARAKLAPDTPAQRRLDWDRVRASYLDATGDATAAAAAWRELGDSHPGDLVIQRQVLAARSTATDRALRERTIARLGALVGDDSLICSLAKAQLLVEARASDADDRAIAELLKRIIAAHPSIPEPRILWATSLRRAGKIDEAVDQMQLAAQEHPDSVALAVQLADLYREKGNFERARQLAERVGASSASSTAELRAAARILAQLGATAKAAEVFERLTARQGADVNDELALAGLRWDLLDLDKVGTALDRILARPESAARPEVLLFAVRFYAAAGKAAASKRLLEQLDALPLPAGRASLIHAELCAAAGDMDGAERFFGQATTSAPTDPATWRALIAYRYRQGRAADAATAIDAALAKLPSDTELQELKRTAPALAAVAPLPELRAIVGEFLQDPTHRPVARQIIAAVARAVAETPSQAVVQARALSQQYPQVLGAQLWAIRTYLKASRLAEATPAVARLTAEFPESVEAASVATSYYATQSRWLEMLEAARGWRKLIRGAADGPDAERADAAVARALVELGRGSEALAQVQRSAEAALGEPAKHVELLTMYAESLRAAGQVGRATESLLPLAAARSPWRDTCVRFAAEKLDAKTAPAWLERLEAWVRADAPNELAQLAEAWAVLSSRFPETKVFGERASSLFAELMREASPPASGLEQAGVFAERGGRKDEAVALYRRAIAADRKRVIAQNNLAMLLASRAQPGDAEEAARSAAAAVEAHPDEPEFLDTLAFVKAKAGEFAPAVAAMARAIELDPENVRWRVVLAQLFADSGQADRAARAVAEIDTMGADLTRLPESLRKQLAALRERLDAAGSGGGGSASPRPATTAPSGAG